MILPRSLPNISLSVITAEFALSDSTASSTKAFEFVFAALLGLAMELFRERIMHCLWRSGLWVYLPLLVYQDVIFLTLLGCLFYGLFSLAQGPRASVRMGRAIV